MTAARTAALAPLVPAGLVVHAGVRDRDAISSAGLGATHFARVGACAAIVGGELP